MQVKGTGAPHYSSGSRRSSHALKNNNQQLQKILEKLSTAQRINRASDDAAGLSIAEQLQMNIRGFKMASQNVENAMAALDITDGAAQQAGDILQRQRELAIAARNDTLNASNRKALNSEYQALNKEIARISQSTEYNNLKTSNGTDLASGNAKIQAGAAAGDEIALPEVDLGTISAALSGSSLTTSAGAATALTSIDSAMASLNSQRSTIGATINQFISTDNSLAVSLVNTQAAESVLRDQDMAEGMAELTRQQLLQEGSIAAFKRFNEISRYNIMGIIQS